MTSHESFYNTRGRLPVATQSKLRGRVHESGLKIRTRTPPLVENAAGSFPRNTVVQCIHFPFLFTKAALTARRCNHTSLVKSELAYLYVSTSDIAQEVQIWSCGPNCELSYTSTGFHANVFAAYRKFRKCGKTPLVQLQFTNVLFAVAAIVASTSHHGQERVGEK